MSPEGTKRKLAAIFSADVKGYSRLMEDDEEATVATLTAYRQVMAEVIEKHSGRVVDAPGDNLLAEFASVVDAMRGAVEIQEELRARNSELPDHRTGEVSASRAAPTSRSETNFLWGRSSSENTR
jgi:class 3 adenylate cyclase